MSLRVGGEVMSEQKLSRIGDIPRGPFTYNCYGCRREFREDLVPYTVVVVGTDTLGNPDKRALCPTCAEAFR